MSVKLKFTAAGDAIIQRPIQEDFAGFSELTPFIMQGDARFFNLETTLNREGEAYGSQFSGGTYIRTNPEVLDGLMELGFNMTSFNNNHVLDFGYPGMLATLRYVEESGLVHAGVGDNLAAASAPRYLETKNGRVALIAVNTSFNATCMAGKQTERVPGRPGINGIRIEEKFTVTEDELAFIRALSTRLRVNVSREIVRREGYYPPLADNEAEFGELKFTLGDETKRTLVPKKADLDRLAKSIYEAKLQADYIMISVHSHQIDGYTKEDVPAFLQEIAHFAIDAGADAVVGHGPHLLRPIEVYKEKPIFYSLGDFVLELYSIEFAPDDFFAKQNMDGNETVHALLKKRSQDFTVGLMEEKKMMETVIPYWETEDGRLTTLRLMPVELSKGGHKSDEGLPRKAQNPVFMERLAEMCKPYGITMEKDADGAYTCKW